MIRLFRWKLILLPLLCVLGVLSYQSYQTARAYVRKQQQFLDRTLALCRFLIPDVPRVQLEARWLTNKNTEGTRASYCSITCLDENGQYRAQLDWSEQTGELFQIGCRTFPIGGDRAIRRPEEAVWAGNAWLRLLEPSVPSRSWQLERRPQAAGRPWVLCWQTPDRRALMVLDGNTGRLLTFNSHLPTAAKQGSEEKIPAGNV